MIRRRPFLLLGSALLAITIHTASLNAQIDQRALAEQLLRGSIGERSRALETARAIQPRNIGPELRAALISTLEREGQLHARRDEADRRGEAVEPLEDPEFIFRVSSVVAELRDPLAIPALTGALGTGSGSPVTTALVAFGEQSVPALLGVVRSPETSHYVVEGALVVLRFLVEGAGPHPLSAATLSAIRRAAKQRLTGTQYFTTLWDAIDLAMALNDSGLRRIVQALASDRDSVRARGIDDAETIADTQRRAAERLAGVPAKPRWR